MEIERIMVPSREIFWNVPFGAVLLYVLAVITVGILVYAMYRRYQWWRLGRPDNRFDHLGRRAWAFIVTGVIDGILHRRFFGAVAGRGQSNRSVKDFLPGELYPGVAHLFIFSGCIVLLLGAFLDFISHYFFDFMHGGFYLGYSVVVDAFGILVLIGVVMAIVRRYILKPDRLNNTADDLIALILIAVVVFTGFLVEGFRIAATELKVAPDWALWSPGGLILARAFSGMSQTAQLASHRVIWWLHTLISLGAVVYVALYWNKLWHILVSPINVFFRSLEPKGALVPVELEAADTFGVSRVEDFSWKQLLDLDACTSCGRCQDNCPAYLSGKSLNPQKVVKDLKASLVERAPGLLKSKGKAEAAVPGNAGRALIGDVLLEDEIWGCTTCYACQEACPVWVEHIDKIIDLRRNLVLERASIPEMAERALTSIEDLGHPWRGTALSREDWAEGLDINVLADESKISDVDILFWVGCTEALAERGIRVAQAVARLLKLAGIRFGILGFEESCCGEPARRLGNEYLFQIQARKNIELMNSYSIKKIVTACPHCYNTIKNEYPQFGGDFEVVHHTEFIASLLKEGRLSITRDTRSVVTYHDPCYLGRHNDIYQPPRQILSSIPGVTTVEMEKNKQGSFCCGGGGGHMWLERGPGQQINEVRLEQAVKTGADIIATACPWCIDMLEDGIRATKEPLTVLDIAELVEMQI
ncbi:EtfAB:quinone oxidoreductase [subsurface metagenome]